MLCCEPTKDDVINAPEEPVVISFNITESLPVTSWYEDDNRFFGLPDLPKLRKNIEPLKSNKSQIHDFV